MRLPPVMCWLPLVASASSLACFAGCGGDPAHPSASEATGSSGTTGPSTGGAGQGGSDTTKASAGAGGAGGGVELPDPLGPLAPTEATSTERFETSRACNQCHFAGDTDVMHDPVSGEDLSPGFQWRSSMMALAARDPYYLAVVSEELDHAGTSRSKVERACLRCHAPAGSEEGGTALTFDELLVGDSPAANLGRDGVTCSLCHQIPEDGLGSWDSFSGSFTIGFERRIFGPHPSPVTQPMEFFLDYTPTYAPHIAESRLCATCHTVLTPMEAGGEFLEQAPFLEWENSSHAATTPCGGCHLGTTDATGAPLATPLATYPEGLAPRSPFGVHAFVGANAYVLSLFAENGAWSGAGVPAEELQAAAARSREHVSTAAQLTLGAPQKDGDELRVPIEVHNLTGHKLPTGYPGRRVWLHLRALGDGGEVLFESGAWDARGRILGVDDDEAVNPHQNLVAPGQVQVWEAVPGDAQGRATHRPLAATRYLKDDRILPAGFRGDGPWVEWTAPVGVAGDESFVAGSDTVTVRIPGEAAVRRVEVELVYQTLPAAAAEHLAGVPTPAAVRFSQMVEGRPPEVLVIAEASRSR